MGAPLNTVAVVVRMLSQIWKKPIVPVNHCVARTYYYDYLFLENIINYLIILIRCGNGPVGDEERESSRPLC